MYKRQELAAQALGCAPERIAKTLSFLVDGGCALVVGATGDWDFGIVLRAALDFAAELCKLGVCYGEYAGGFFADLCLSLIHI